MILKAAILAATLAALSIPASAADGIVVGYRDVVEPDPAVVRFSNEVAREWMNAGGYDFPAIDRLFAPVVQTFMKNETPFQPFEARNPITSDYILNSVFTLQAKKGSVPEEEVPEYRGDAITDIATQIVQSYPWGTLPEVPGMICKGAAFDVDRQAVAKFARMQGVRIDKLVFYDKPVTLYEEPDSASKVVGIVPAGTLMVFDKHNRFGGRWHPMVVSGGLKGYLGEFLPERTLVQKHVCFAKVEGKYRIAAIFGYGF